MDTLQLDLNKRYTYDDYITWIDNVRRELFDGFIKLMSPAPTRKHQLISINLERFFINYLYKKKCKVYHAPFDVRLPENGVRNGDNIYTVVQPDICVICDPEKLDERGCFGAPDLIIEIVSKKNPGRDVKDKFQIYEKHGVNEYWIIFPNDETISVFVLNNKGKYQLISMYAGEDKIPVNIFNGDLMVEVKEVFEE